MLKVGGNVSGFEAIQCSGESRKVQSEAPD